MGKLGSLAPIRADEWNRDKARHLLDRAGFGGTPNEIDRLARLTPRQAVSSLIHLDTDTETEPLPPFVHSDVFEEGLDPFPPSRPATTALASRTGEALGIKVKQSGNRPMQAIVNQFFYWLLIFVSNKI